MGRVPKVGLGVAIALLVLVAFVVSRIERTTTFARTVVQHDDDGAPYPIEQLVIPGVLTEIPLALSGGRRLVVRSNAADLHATELDRIQADVDAAYRFVEEATGRTIDGDLLLTLALLDEVPPSYHVEMKVPAEENAWAFAGWIVLARGLEDRDGELAKMLLGTIPHELGHVALKQVRNLPHDDTLRPSHHTRWFIDGACEVLAQGFAREQDGAVATRHLRTRNADRVLGDAVRRDLLFTWGQYDERPDDQTSDLYGAALLVVDQWTRAKPLRAILDEIDAADGPLDGAALRQQMLEDVGVDAATLLDRAHEQGRAWLGDRAPADISVDAAP